MFTKNELAQHPSIAGLGSLPLIEVEFRPHHFRRPNGGAHMITHYATKEDADSAIDFWSRSVELADYPLDDAGRRRLAAQALCQAIDCNEFFTRVEDLLLLGEPKRPVPDFLTRRWYSYVYDRGMMMYEDADYVALRHSMIAEYEDSYVAFHSRIPL